MYRDRGVRVWAIASADARQSDVEYFVEALDIDMPVFYDEGGVVQDDYITLASVPAGAYPQEWIIGTDGTVVYHWSQYDHDAIVDVLESQL